MDVKKIISDLTKVAGLKQDAIAAELETTQATVSRWASGSDPRGSNRDALYDLAVKYGVMSEASSIPAAPQIPMLAWVSAGALTQVETVEDLDQVTYVDGYGLDPSGDWIALRVEGRSMDKISPHDSIIYVNRKEKTLIPNACYVVSDGEGGATYKRYRPPNRLEPVSTKSDFEVITFEPEQPPEVIGRVRKSELLL